MTSDPDRIDDIHIEGIRCEIRITGAQKPEYQIEIVPFPYPAATKRTALLMAKLAGIDKRNTWTAKGPFNPVFRQNLAENLDYNYARETLPSDSDPVELEKVTHEIVDYYVECLIFELRKEGFPKEAEPVFRQFAREDFALSVGLTIGEYWKFRKGGHGPALNQ